MIDFTEELKKFSPSPEVEELEDTIHHLDVTDAVDLFIRVIKEEEA